MNYAVRRAPRITSARHRRHRRYRKYRLSRWATFGTGIAAPLAGWLDLHQAAGWAGLAVLEIAGIVIIPVAVLAVLFFLPTALTGGLVPRSWRIAHRDRHAHHCDGCADDCDRHGRDKCRSSYITRGLRRVVFAADRYACVYCGACGPDVVLQVDHVRPWSRGGLTSLFNCMTLCAEHNLVKLNYWRDRDGYIWYRPSERSAEKIAVAAMILAAERARRWNPFRLLRAAWALG